MSAGSRVPWSMTEMAVLRASRTFAAASAALPDRTAVAIRKQAALVGNRFDRPASGARGPRTVDEQRFARLLVAVPAAWPPPARRGPR